MSKKQPKEYRTDEKTKEEAMKIAMGIQKQGQTKEQTKLIAQGIQKGIAVYRDKEKALARERDKIRKRDQRNKNKELEADESGMEVENNSSLINKVTTFLAVWGVLLTTAVLVGIVTDFIGVTIK